LPILFKRHNARDKESDNIKIAYAKKSRCPETKTLVTQEKKSKETQRSTDKKAFQKNHDF